MNSRELPQRLNLAIARRCEVACRGCYTYFGRAEPDIARFLPTVAAFVRLGIDKVTLSGGDPLTIDGIRGFLSDLRAIGVRSIKLDTVGVGLASASSMRMDLYELVRATNCVGIPVDGWSDESVLEFRAGRSQLFTETMELLDAFDELGGKPMVVVHTVAHAGNWRHLERIHSNWRDILAYASGPFFNTRQPIRRAAVQISATPLGMRRSSNVAKDY
jgi:molybdenum cofactor biosynthesis enzyme MoaA